MVRYRIEVLFKDRSNELEIFFSTYKEALDKLLEWDENMVESFYLYYGEKVLSDNFIDATYLAHDYLRDNNSVL